MYVDTIYEVHGQPSRVHYHCRDRQTLQATPIPDPCEKTISNSWCGPDGVPRTRRGNKYVLVLQDYLTKWPLAYTLPDQKALTMEYILVEKVIPFFGVPEALLTDRGTNLLSHLMKDLCKLLRISLVLGDIRKIKTVRYCHKIPRYDGLVIVTKFL